MPAPNTFTTTANRVEFIDFSGDRLIMRAEIPSGAPVIKIRTESADAERGSANIFIPMSCVGELIESLQHLTNRAEELAETLATTSE